MKKILLSAAVCLLSVAATAQPAQRLIDQYADHTVSLIVAVEGLTDQAWAFRESAERWSIGEVVEHIVLAEQLLLEQVRQSVLTSPETQPAPVDEQAQADEQVARNIVDRTRPAQAPPPAQPTGKYQSPTEALRAFIQVRSQTLALLEQYDEATLRRHRADSPLEMPLDGYQWMLFIVGHGQRHLQQIAQVKAHAGYPGM
jgi:hypothetical protein